MHKQALPNLFNNDDRCRSCRGKDLTTLFNFHWSFQLIISESTNSNIWTQLAVLNKNNFIHRHNKHEWLLCDFWHRFAFTKPVILGGKLVTESNRQFFMLESDSRDQGSNQLICNVLLHLTNTYICENFRGGQLPDCPPLVAGLVVTLVCFWSFSWKKWQLASAHSSEETGITLGKFSHFCEIFTW